MDDFGLRLAFIDDGSDGFPLIVITEKDFEDINHLASQLGRCVKNHFA